MRARKLLHKREPNYDEAARLFHGILMHITISLVRGCNAISEDSDLEDDKRQIWADYVSGMYLNANTLYDDLPDEKKDALKDIVKQLFESITLQ